MAGDYLDAFDAVSKKCEEEGFKSLNEYEAVIFTVWWLEAEVNNGGFDQFFNNASRMYINETVHSLELVGAVKTKALLLKAIDIVYPGGLPADASKIPIQADCTEEMQAQLNNLDDAFSSLEEDITALVNGYLNDQTLDLAETS